MWIRAQNLLLRNLFAFDDVFVVENDEEFRIDLLVRDIVTDDGKVAGHTISLYMFARADWPSVGDTLLDEGQITEEERPVFDKLTANTYFPLFFWSDYCTPEAMNQSFEKVTAFINDNFFESTRQNRASENEQSEAPAGE